MRCSACGEANRDQARFCASCGDALALQCGACGNEIAASARFCDSCGEPVTGDGATPERSAPAQTRKVVTIVFADLVGSTSLEEQMDPESVRAVMDSYYAIIRDVVDEHRGRVVKFIGDGVMAVFGVPDTSEGDSLRALDAALAMHDEFADLAFEVARDRHAEIALRVGVNTGEVIVSAGDNDVVGDAVNLAARLEHAAAPGTVLVGEETWRLTRGVAVFEAVPPLDVAGKANPVNAYRLVSVEGPVPDLGTEFVGRSEELETLAAVFDDVARSGTARLAVVLGSPGVGKTRLASELQRSLAGRATPFFASCSQDGTATLAPIADVVRVAAGVGETADAATVVRTVDTLIPDDEADRERIVASAAAILGAGSMGTPEETFWTVRRVLEVAARERPVVLVLDDLHWAEPMLLDLVDHLSEWMRAPVMVVGLARPELRDLRGSMVDASRRAVIALEGLDRPATRQLACELLATEELPPRLLDRLPESTGGNPLFLRELLRMLVDDDILRREDGSWHLSVAPEAIDVPPTIQSLLAARLDRLPPDEQLLLERASIVGKEFSRGAVHELVGSTNNTNVDALLENLRRKELVEPDGTYWIDEPVYRFHHVLIRDAAYRRVLRQTRAELHEQLARWLETKVGAVIGEHEELIGYHFEQAYVHRRELGPLDAHDREVGRDAGARLGAAAEHALDRDDLAAASSLAARALACRADDDTERSDALLVQCEALLARGEAGAAAVAVADLGQYASVSPRLAAWSACFRAQLATMTDSSRLHETERQIAEVATDFTALGDARGAAKAHIVHAATLARLGRFADVEAALHRALAAARDAGDRRMATVALAAAPVAQVWGPSPVPRAGGRCLDVVRLLRITAGSPAVEATSQCCQGVLEAFRGRADAARRMVGTARAALEELGLVHGLLETEMFAGIVELVSGDADAAAHHLRLAYDGMRALGVDADAARAAALLARVQLTRECRDEAAHLAAEAERLAGDDLQSVIAWRGARAEILATQERFEDAVALAEEAVRIAAGTDALVLHADACLALARVRRAGGDRGGASEAALAAAELYARKGASALAESARALADRPGQRQTRSPSDPDLTREPANRCTEAFRRWELYFAARDWVAMGEAVSDGFEYLDHQLVVGAHDVGRAAHVAQMQIVAEQGFARIGMTFLATRGERLALATLKGAVPDDFASANLAVIEYGDERLASITTFDPGDVDGAMQELDRRYLEGEGAPFASVVRLVVASNTAYNARDWDGFRACYDTDVLAIDHRLAGWGTLAGVERQIETLQGLIEMVPDVRLTMEAITAVSTNAILYSARVCGRDRAESRVELAFHVLNRGDGDGISAMEIFPADALEDALLAFHGPAEAMVLRNACVESGHRFAVLAEQRDWTAMHELCASGGGSTVESMRVMSELGLDTVRYAPIAIRGDRLAVGRYVFEGSGDDQSGFDSQFLSVAEIDTDGKLVWGMTFEPEDLEAALTELELRYLAGEGAPYTAVVELGMELTAAYNTRDWDRARKLYPEDLVVVDHRPATFGTVRGREEYLETVEALVDVIPGISMRIAASYPTPHGILVLLQLSSASDDGAVVEVAVYAIALVRDDKLARVEYFPLEALAFARARFEELGRDVETGSLFGNACWRAVAGLNDTCVATRGERLALVRRAASALGELVLYELDDGGVVRDQVFDAHDLSPALTALDERYLACEGTPYAMSIRNNMMVNAACNARDWHALLMLHAPDVVVVDHRPASLGEFTGREIFVHDVQGMVAVVPNMFMWTAATFPRQYGGVSLVRAKAVTDDGGEVENVFWAVGVVRDGMVTRMEYFPVEAFDAAMARSDELQAAALTV